MRRRKQLTMGIIFETIGRLRALEVKSTSFRKGKVVLYYAFTIKLYLNLVMYPNISTADV